MRFIRYDVLLLVIVVGIGAAVVAAQHVIAERQRAAAQQGTAPQTAQCPICKEQIQVTDATPRYVHDGKIFYFLNEEMKQEFIAKVQGAASAGGQGERR